MVNVFSGNCLAEINDERAIKPLLQTLIGREELPLINAKAGPEKIRLVKNFSNLGVIEGLFFFSRGKAQYAAMILQLILTTEQDHEIESHLRGSIDKMMPEEGSVK